MAYDGQLDSDDIDAIEQLLRDGVPDVKSETTETDSLVDGSSGTSHDPDDLEGLVPLRSITAASQSSVDFDQNIDSTYQKYVIVMSEVTLANDGVPLAAYLSNDGGSSYLDSSDKYARVTETVTSAGTNYQTSENSSFELAYIAVDVGNASGEELSGQLELYTPAQSGVKTRATTTANYNRSGGDVRLGDGAGQRDVAETNDAIRIQPGSGDISTGEFSLYGVTTP